MSTEPASTTGSKGALKRAPSARLPKAALVLAGMLALGLTAGCGKKDDPQPPGPNPTYPKTYPTS